MDAAYSKNRMYVRRLQRHSKKVAARMAIIVSFTAISTLVSVLLPVYFALLPLSGK
jgi:hypothetical protein